MRRYFVIGVRVVASAAVATMAFLGFVQTAQAAQTSLERAVLEAVRSAGFTDVLDSRYSASTQPRYPRANVPNLDITVIDLSPDNRSREAVNVILSRDYPEGVVVPIEKDLSGNDLDYRKWDLARWNTADNSTWSAPFPPDSELVPGRENAKYQLMLPYPASVFKVMVAYGIMRLVDSEKIDLGGDYTYPGNPSGTGLCGSADPTTKSYSDWMTEMITVSSNRATCAMLLKLHQLDEVDALNKHFDDIGLPSLEITGTSAETGGSWNPGQISMGSLDTAKLMWLTDGGPGTLWRTPAGDPITQDLLSASSREFLKGIYARQGFNEVISTTNWCGNKLGANFPDSERVYPPQGIPTPVPEEFIVDGEAEVDGIPYGRPVAPCNEAAEVLFSHKTGLTTNAGADAGYVHALPGKQRRDYAVAVITNLGNRFTDQVMNTSLTNPLVFGCWTDMVVCYSEAFAKFGKSIDDALKAERKAALRLELKPKKITLKGKKAKKVVKAVVRNTGSLASTGGSLCVKTPKAIKAVKCRKFTAIASNGSFEASFSFRLKKAVKKKSGSRVRFEAKAGDLTARGTVTARLVKGR